MARKNKEKEAPREARKGAGKAAAGGSDWVAQQLRFFRRLAHRAIGAAVISGCLNIFLFVVALGLWFRVPAPRYFAATPQLRLLKMTPLNEPVLSKAGLLNWTAETITKTFGLDFVHWRQQLSDVEQDYTHKAFTSMIGSLQKSGNLDYIRKKRLSVSATPTRSPVIVQTGHIGSAKVWKIQMPLLLSYESSQGVVNTQNTTATVLVKRVSTLKFPHSVAIAQIVLNAGSN